MDITYHYPPELLSLLIEVIPRLCKSKDDVLIFFKGAGANPGLLFDFAHRVETDRSHIKKHEIARAVLVRISERGDSTLALRREVLKRVVEFESYTGCWHNDVFAAKALVADIRRVVNAKDTFTRINIEREEERSRHKHDRDLQTKAIQDRKVRLEEISKRLCALFSDTNPHRRGKSLEKVLNDLFAFYGVLVREAFAIVGSVCLTKLSAALPASSDHDTRGRQPKPHRAA